MSESAGREMDKIQKNGIQLPLVEGGEVYLPAETPGEVWVQNGEPVGEVIDENSPPETT